MPHVDMYNRPTLAFDLIVTYGIGKRSGSVEKVLLESTYLQGRYFLSKPFFKYEIISDNAEAITVSMQVIINFELTRKICSFGESVKVLMPKHLADGVKEYHQKAIQKYLPI